MLIYAGTKSDFMIDTENGTMEFKNIVGKICII